MRALQTVWNWLVQSISGLKSGVPAEQVSRHPLPSTPTPSSSQVEYPWNDVFATPSDYKLPFIGAEEEMAAQSCGCATPAVETSTEPKTKPARKPRAKKTVSNLTVINTTKSRALSKRSVGGKNVSLKGKTQTPKETS